jgi:hypothetical protein
MAYKSQVTNKYMGTSFKGAPRSNRNPASTELGQIVSALKNDLSPAIKNWADVNILKMKDDATKKMQKLYLSGKSSKDINKEILAGKHEDLEHKYTEAVVNGQLGRFDAYETINKIKEEIGNYKPREQTLESFWQGYLPNFDEKGQFFTEGFATVFSEYKAKSLMTDANERAVYQEGQKVNGVVNSLITEYEMNGFVADKTWQLIESFGSPLPFSGKKGNYFINNASKNKAAFIFADTLVKTAKTETQLDDVLSFLDEYRGGKHELKSLGETYNADEIGKLRARIIAKRDAIKTDEYNSWVRNKTKKGHNFLQDYNAYKYGGTLSDGTIIDRLVNIEGEDKRTNYDEKAEETYQAAKDFDITLASTMRTLDSNVNEHNRDTTMIKKLMTQVQQGLWIDNPIGLAKAIADYGGNNSDSTSLGNQNFTIKQRIESGQSLFPFQTDNFWTNSSARLTRIMDTDDTLIKIAPNDAEMMMITNTVVQEYERMVMEWYATDEGKEPSMTLDGGTAWQKWNERRVDFRNETMDDLLSTYKTEAYFKRAMSLIEQGNTNKLSTLVASDVTKDAIEKVFETTVTQATALLEKHGQTFENFKEESARLLTPISELQSFKQMVNSVRNGLATAGVTNVDDDEIKKMLFDQIGLSDADVDLEAVKQQFISNTENVITEGFEKSFPTLVKDKAWTFWTDEAKNQIPQITEFLNNTLGELTGMGDDFAPQILLRMDDAFIDMIAQALGADPDVFRTALGNSYPELKGKL